MSGMYQVRNWQIAAFVAGAGAATWVMGYCIYRRSERRMELQDEILRYYPEDPVAKRLLVNAPYGDSTAALEQAVRLLAGLDTATDGVADHRIGPCTPEALGKLADADRPIAAREVERAAYEASQGGESCIKLADALGVPEEKRLGFYTDVDRFQHGEPSGSLDDMDQRTKGTFLKFWGPERLR